MPNTEIRKTQMQELTHMLPHIHLWADKNYIHRPYEGEAVAGFCSRDVKD